MFDCRLQHSIISECFGSCKFRFSSVCGAGNEHRKEKWRETDRVSERMSGFWFLRFVSSDQMQQIHRSKMIESEEIIRVSIEADVALWALLSFALNGNGCKLCAHETNSRTQPSICTGYARCGFHNACGFHSTKRHVPAPHRSVWSTIRSDFQVISLSRTRIAGIQVIVSHHKWLLRDDLAWHSRNGVN